MKPKETVRRENWTVSGGRFELAAADFADSCSTRESVCVQVGLHFRQGAFCRAAQIMRQLVDRINQRAYAHLHNDT